LHNGELLHSGCFVLDITEKKRADEAQMKAGRHRGIVRPNAIVRQT